MLNKQEDENPIVGIILRIEKCLRWRLILNEI